MPVISDAVENQIKMLVQLLLRLVRYSWEQNSPFLQKYVIFWTLSAMLECSRRSWIVCLQLRPLALLHHCLQQHEHVQHYCLVTPQDQSRRCVIRLDVCATIVEHAKANTWSCSRFRCHACWWIDDWCSYLSVAVFVTCVCNLSFQQKATWATSPEPIFCLPNLGHSMQGKAREFAVYNLPLFHVFKRGVLVERFEGLSSVKAVDRFIRSQTDPDLFEGTSPSLTFSSWIICQWRRSSWLPPPVLKSSMIPSKLWIIPECLLLVFSSVHCPASVEIFSLHILYAQHLAFVNKALGTSNTIHFLWLFEYSGRGIAIVQKHQRGWTNQRVVGRHYHQVCR